MMKQTDELNVTWTNTAEDEWFHAGIPWATNLDSQWCEHNKLIVQCYGTRFMDPNITWGGNPASSASAWSNAHPWFVDYNTSTGQQDYIDNGIPAGAMGHFKLGSTNYEMSPMMWSKRMMDLLPKTKRPPPRILVRAKETPESSSNVTWTAMMETTVTIEIVPNSMGYLHLNLGDAMAGWCGDNMFGMRTAPNGMNNTYDPANRYSNASTEGGSYENRWRDNHDSFYQVNTDSYPKCWGRNDGIIDTQMYEEDLDDDSFLRGRRRLPPPPYDDDNPDIPQWYKDACRKLGQDTRYNGPPHHEDDLEEHSPSPSPRQVHQLKNKQYIQKNKSLLFTLLGL